MVATHTQKKNYKASNILRLLKLTAQSKSILLEKYPNVPLGDGYSFV